jgi:hypothetical protein
MRGHGEGWSTRSSVSLAWLMRLPRLDSRCGGTVKWRSGMSAKRGRVALRAVADWLPVSLMGYQVAHGSRAHPE